MEQMSPSNSCKICGSKTEALFDARILGKYDVPFHQCMECEFLAPDSIFWLEEAYREPINPEDTGLVSRNIFMARLTTLFIYFIFGRKGKFLDYAGGYGMLTRLMRDYGADYYWYDTYTENLFARGFESEPGSGMEFTLLTAFECFEHFESPLSEIENILNLSRNILFSTVLLPSPLPAPGEWWYYEFQHGQHVAFYSSKTLQRIADKFGLHLYSFQNVHLFTTRKISPLLYRLLVKTGPKLVFPLLPTEKNSKTMEDHDRIKEKYRHTQV